METIAGFYDLDLEHDRLSRGLSLIEIIRTPDILARVLPPTPATWLDIGGGSRVYAREWLRPGYTLNFMAVMPGHVERVRADPQLRGLASVTLWDARALPHPDAAADVALLPAAVPPDGCG